MLFLQGWAMSCALTGCLAGAIISGWLSDGLEGKNYSYFLQHLFIAASLGTGCCRLIQLVYYIQDTRRCRNRSCFKPFTHVYCRDNAWKCKGQVCFNQSAYNCNRHPGCADNKLEDSSTCTRRGILPVIFSIHGTDRQGGDGCSMPVLFRRYCSSFYVVCS